MTDIPWTEAETATEPLSTWTRDATDAWGTGAVTLSHRLGDSGLFTDAALADLIDDHPAGGASLVSMGAFGSERKWRTGRYDALTGAQLLDVLRTESLWLNVRAVDVHHPAYARLFDGLLAELGRAVPGLDPVKGKMGVLISGPNTKVDYHADLPGQALIQLRGRKTVVLYPSAEPYVSLRDLQDIAYDGVEKLPYRPEFEDGATRVELRPGQMVHWPLNAPHRVENGDMLNVSVTFEYLTRDIKRLMQANLANGILRRRWGVETEARPTGGAGSLARRVLQAGYAKLGLLERDRATKEAESFELTHENGAVTLKAI